MNNRKKLIEVALPLEAINIASAREKNIRHGHPSALHLWWARRPLAACRAVLFGSLVDDPSSWPEKFPTEESQEEERQRLFDLIEELVKWENSNNRIVLDAARAEIARSIAWNLGDQVPMDVKSVQKYLNEYAPPVLDPFCGGGAIPLEAQRLGLLADASDLNPVAVLITKALIEIPPKFAGRPPVNPDARSMLDHSGGWQGTRGLAEDVRYYSKWMRAEADRRIGHLYPKVKLAKGGEATVIAWLWARTVKCPNPACGAMMPLVRSFWLSTKRGRAWVEPIINQEAKTVSFGVNTGKSTPPEGTVSRRGGRCIVCSTNAPLSYIRAEGKAGRMNAQLMAIVAEGERERLYRAPDEQHERIVVEADPQDVPETDLPEQALGFRVQGYGMKKHRDLFTARQLVALTTFSDIVSEAKEYVLSDAHAAGMNDSDVSLDKGGIGATAYADAVVTYLAFLVDQLANHQSSICSWNSVNAQMRNVFARQTISMTWDYAESNPFCESSGSYHNLSERQVKGFLAIPAESVGRTKQVDATAVIPNSVGMLVSTDPPYYDNIGYADLSDFFYIWLRRALNRIYPDLFSTLLVPKKQELVAAPFRFGGSNEDARQFFEEGSLKAFTQMRKAQHLDYPLTVFYAFKQSEDEEDESGVDVVSSSTGWETMLEGLIRAGFIVTGTIPMRTERAGRSRDIESNALATSIVLVCRPRGENAALATRREFLNELKRELPDSLKKLQHGNIAPVDLAQAAIGPGMAVFSRYAKVVESDGSSMRVRTALQLINQALDEVLAEQESEYDADTRWAVAWFDQFGMSDGPYGTAETLSKAKNTSVSGMDEAGVTISRAGKVRLLRRDELSDEWDPASDKHLTVWEVAQHLIRALDNGGDAAAARLYTKVGGLAEVARDLAYRLYTASERKGWPQEALAYNSLVVAWPEIKRLAATPATTASGTLFDELSSSNEQ